MRRLVVVLAVVLVAACSSHPSHTAPPSSDTAASTPTVAASSEASAFASSVVSNAPGSGPTGAPIDTSAWLAVAPSGEGFSVKMPGEAKPSTMTLKTPVGDAPTTLWTYTDGTNRVFAVALSRFPAGALAKAPVAKVPDGSVSGAARAVANLSIASQSDLTLDGHAGRSFLLTSSKLDVQGEIILVGDTEYTIGVNFAVGQTDDGAVAAFLASFQLTV